MATNQVIISHLNPLHFFPKKPTVFPQYNRKDIDDYPFYDRIRMDQEKVRYKQKWQTSDAIVLQFESNFSPIQLDLFNLDYPSPMVTLSMTQVGSNPRLPGWYIYQASISLAGLPEGEYRVDLSPGNNPDDQYECEPLEVWEKTPMPTVYQEYKHSSFHEDVIFETGIQFAIRVEADIGKLNPYSEDTLYKDEKGNIYQLNSKPGEFEDFAYGGSLGIPDWMVRKLNRIWTCDFVSLDRKLYCKNLTNNTAGSGNIEIVEEEDYPLYGLTMQIAPGINRSSRIIAPTVDTTKKLIVAHLIDGTLFGDLSANVGENLIPINSIE